MNSKNSKKSSASESESQPEPEPESGSRTTSKSQTYIFLEILCVFFWFLLDGFWLLEWKFLTYLFSGVALATAVLMFRFIQRERIVILVACADTSWLLLNVLWALGDLSQIQQAILAAKILFLVGGLFCFVALWASESHKRLHVLALSRMRIIKLFQPPPTR